MATRITFTKDTTICELPAPAPGGKLELARAQALGVTAGGSRVVVDGGVERILLAESFCSLTSAEKASLDAFFSGTVNGMRLSFIYVDAYGASRSVRFASPALAWTEAAPGVHDVAVQLEVAAE